VVSLSIKFFASLLALALPVAIFILVPSSGTRIFTPSIGIAIFLMYYISARVSYLSRKSALDLFLVTIYIFFYVSSGIAVIAMGLGRVKLKFDWAFALENMWVALLASITSLIVTEFAYTKKLNELKNTSRTIIPFSSRFISIISCVSILLNLIHFTLIPLNILFDSRASVGSALNSFGSSDSGNAVTGILVALTKIMPLCLMIYVILGRRARYQKIKFIDYFAMGLVCIAINPISSARYVFLLAVISLGAAIFFIPQDWRAEFIVYAGIILAIIVFPNIDFARYEKGEFKVYSISESLSNVANKDFDQIPMGALTLQITDNKKLPIGKQLLGEFGFWVPRQIWDSKPYDTSKVLASEAGLRNTNLSIPLWAEGWASFRLLGIFLYPWVLGYFTASIKGRSRTFPSYRGMYIFLCGAIFVIQRGPLLQLTGIITFGLFTFYLLSKFEKSLQKNY